MITREECARRDAEDGLAPLRDQFDLPAGVIYLDGNSLGALPKKALARAEEIIRREWGQDLINSWNKNAWWDLPVTLGDQMAPLVGAGAGEIVVTDTTSLNLYKVFANALRMQQKDGKRKVIVAERENFPTYLYMIQGFVDLLDQGYQVKLIGGADELPAALGDDVAVVVLAQVNYRSGYLWDMAAANRRVHDAGALVVWDLCHSIGAVPIDLKGSGADFAIGCTYKYVNGGPGAPAMLWANPAHRAHYGQPLTGWWGHARPFDMAVQYQADPGIRSFLCGTQGIVSMGLVACGVDILLQAGMDRVRAKSLALTDLFIELVEQECAGMDLTLVTPRKHAHRGSHVSFRHPQAYGIVRALIDRQVIGDYREPEVARFGVTPLYLRHVDIWDAVQHLKAVLTKREWGRPQYKERSAVT